MYKCLFQTLLILMLTIAMGACEPAKMSTPDNTVFDPKTFSFSDYQNKKDLEHFFKNVFKPGSSKQDVDQILVDAGKARITRTYEYLDIEPKYIFDISNPNAKKL